MEQEPMVAAPHKNNIAIGVLLAVALSAAIIAGGIVYAFQSKQNSDTKAELQAQVDSLKSQLAALPTATPKSTASLTNDQLFQEVSTQLGLMRSELTYFRIFGQDRVQYSTGSGTTFAYKTDDTWRKAGPESQQSLIDCSLVSSVPENYRPMCVSGSQTLYMNSDKTSANYPPREAVSYIGQ